MIKNSSFKQWASPDIYKSDFRKHCQSFEEAEFHVCQRQLWPCECVKIYVLEFFFNVFVNHGYDFALKFIILLILFRVIKINILPL